MGINVFILALLMFYRSIHSMDEVFEIEIKVHVTTVEEEYTDSVFLITCINNFNEDIGPFYLHNTSNVESIDEVKEDNDN